jgi:hypothetical protein
MAGGQHARNLTDRLGAVEVSRSAAPWHAWLQLRATGGNSSTVIDPQETPLRRPDAHPDRRGTA